MANQKYHLDRDYYNPLDVHVVDHPAFTLTEVETLPSTVDISPMFTPVFDQGHLGSCSGNAFAGALEYLENKKYFEPGKPFSSLSRLFVYYCEREIEGDIPDDAGAQLSDGIKALTNVGIASESTWPYLINRFAVKPSDEAYNDASARKITASARVSALDGMDVIKRTLLSGYPIVFGFMVYSSFESDIVAQTGVVNLPMPGEQCQGGHAVVMVGYDDTTQTVKVRNSWGPAWGKGGYFTLPYAYIVNPSLTSDMWTITN